MFPMFTVAMGGSAERPQGAGQRRLAFASAESEEAGKGGHRPAAQPAVHLQAWYAEAPPQCVERTLQAANRNSGNFHHSIITR
jgi:hypothetical protein